MNIIPYGNKPKNIMKKNLINIKINPLFVLFLFIIAKAWNDMHNQYFWADESGQFWMAQGLNHYSPPLTPNQSILKMFNSNANYSYDPGGFTLIVRVWAEISTNYFWLRLLPELFFFTALYGILLILRIYKVTNLSSSLILFFVSIGITGGDGSFFRPYSAELFAFVYVLLFVIKLLKNPYHEQEYLPKIILLSTFGIWMRYSGFIWTLGILLSLIILRKKQILSKKTINWNNLLAGFALLLSTILIFFLSFRIQSRNSINLFYYTYLSDTPKFLLNRYNVIFYFFLIGLYLYSKCNNQKYLSKELYEFQVIYLILFTVNLFTSTIGLYPWHPWSHVYSPIPVGFVILAGITLRDQFRKLKLLTPKFTNLVAATIYLTVLMHMGIANFFAPLTHNDVTTFFNNKSNQCRGEKILVNRWDSPAVRFYFEKQRPDQMKPYDYPAKFTFIIPEFVNGKNSKIYFQNLNDYCALIIPGDYSDLNLKLWKEIVPNAIWIK